MSYLIRRVLAKPRLILDEMCRLYGKFASYKTRLIFPRINGPNEHYPGYQRFYLACDEELSRPQAETSSVFGRRH